MCEIKAKYKNNKSGEQVTIIGFTKVQDNNDWEKAVIFIVDQDQDNSFVQNINDFLKLYTLVEEAHGDINNSDAKLYIETKGADYAVRHYISYKSFEDPITRKLWKNAELALNELEEYLGIE